MGQILARLDAFRRTRLATALVAALAIFTDMLVYGIVVPILPQKLMEMGVEADAIGWLFGSYALGLLLLTPVFGIVSDRLGSRRVPMLAGLLGLAVATLLFNVATTYGGLVAARIAQGVSGGASWTIGLSMIADVYPKERLGAVMGTVLSANTLGFLLGPPIGGFTYQYIGKSAPFYLCSILAFVDFLARLAVIPPRPNDHQTIEPHAITDDMRLNTPTRQHSPVIAVPSKNTHIMHGFISALRSPLVLVVLGATVVVSLVVSGMEPTLPLHLEQVFHADNTTIGLMFTAIVIPNILVSIVVGHLSDRYGRLLIASVGMFLLAVVTPFVAVARSYEVLIVMLMLNGASNGVAMTPFVPELAEHVTATAGAGYGTIYALFNMSYSVGMLCGPVLAGYIYAAGFLTVLLSLSGLLLACSPLVAYFHYYKSRAAAYRTLVMDVAVTQTLSPCADVNN